MRVKVLILCLLCTSPILATRRYVAPTGNDANSGATLATAWRTLQRAANLVNAGDTVFVTDSTYAGFDLRRSGTSTNRIVFIANSKNVIINRRNAVTTDGINIENANWIKIQGFRVINQPRAGIRVVQADNITISDNICTNNSRWGIFTGFTDNFIAEYNECAYSAIEHGIYVSNSSDNAIIRYNTSHHNRAAGLHFNGDISQGEDGINHSPQVYNNRIYKNGLGGGSAINMDGNQDALIYNNLIYDNYATGIALYQIDGGGPSTGAKIFYNTIVQDDTSRWAILLVNGAANATLKNNIIINQHSFRGSINIDAASRSGLVSDYNIFTNRFTLTDGNSVIDSTAWKNLGYDSHSFFNPNLSNLFTNYALGDFTLKTGSKAINFGTTDISASIPFDFNTNNRINGAAPDAGAFESTSNAPLSIKWITASVRKVSNYLQINGQLADVSAGTSVCLTKWNSITQKFDQLECKMYYTTSSLLDVTFNDKSPLKNGAQYQLVATETNGNSIKSSIVIYRKTSSLSLTTFPNPTIDRLNIEGDLESINQLLIQDVSGKIVRQIKNPDNTVDLKNIIPGIYIISFISQNQIIKTSLLRKE